MARPNQEKVRSTTQRRGSTTSTCQWPIWIGATRIALRGATQLAEIVAQVLGGA
jgi:hypothetical protein